MTTCAICDKPTNGDTVIGVPVCDSLRCADLQDAKGYASAGRSRQWPPAGHVVCPTCEGTGRGASEWHYVRGHGIQNDCGDYRCDGRGYIRSETQQTQKEKEQ